MFDSDPRENGDQREEIAAMLRADNPRRRGAAAPIRATTSAGISPQAGKRAGLEAGRNPRKGGTEQTSRALRIQGGQGKWQT